jgi:O-6-methylguanine DNA methyltransferase
MLANIFKTPFGFAATAYEGEALRGVVPPLQTRELASEAIINRFGSFEPYPGWDPVACELGEYFRGGRMYFTVKPELAGFRVFERRVYESVMSIGYGLTMTYSDVALGLGSKAWRAVGNALGKNPMPIIIPCHRVVGCGAIGGYRFGAKVKDSLLRLEGAV